MGNIGNTFDSKTFSIGHARKVWREIRKQYPGGGTVDNIADWVEKGLIPSGRPCKFDTKEKTLTVYTPEQVTAGTAADLGINGYIQEDICVRNGETVGTATVIYDGELYEYMFSEAEATVLKANTLTPMIVWVQ